MVENRLYRTRQDSQMNLRQCWVPKRGRLKENGACKLEWFVETDGADQERKRFCQSNRILMAIATGKAMRRVRMSATERRMLRELDLSSSKQTYGREDNLLDLTKPLPSTGDWHGVFDYIGTTLLPLRNFVHEASQTFAYI